MGSVHIYVLNLSAILNRGLLIKFAWALKGKEKSITSATVFLLKVTDWTFSIPIKWLESKSTLHFP